jgi:hypothetical protein
MKGDNDMKYQERFKNVFHYANCIGEIIKNTYKELSGHTLKYTFASDLATADWVSGEKGIKETYSHVKKYWLGDYKAWTEFTIALNYLGWFNDDLANAGYEGRNQLAMVYINLYNKATDEFYKKYEKNKEACEHFFRMTD